jgi:hypothetical protein
MSSALTGNKIKDSYQALLKMGTNGSLDPVTAIAISDGLGNDTPLLLSGIEFKTQVVSAAKLYGFWADLSSNSHLAIGDYAGQYNGTFLYVSDLNKVIQANGNGGINGFNLDFNSNNYKFGELFGNTAYLSVGINSSSLFGNEAAYLESSNKQVIGNNGLNQLIYTSNDNGTYSGDRGFKLDFSTNVYTFGDPNGIAYNGSLGIGNGASELFSEDNYLALYGPSLNTVLGYYQGSIYNFDVNANSNNYVFGSDWLMDNDDDVLYPFKYNTVLNCYNSGLDTSDKSMKYNLFVNIQDGGFALRPNVEYDSNIANCFIFGLTDFLGSNSLQMWTDKQVPTNVIVLNGSKLDYKSLSNNIFSVNASDVVIGEESTGIHIIGGDFKDKGNILPSSHVIANGKRGIIIEGRGASVRNDFVKVTAEKFYQAVPSVVGQVQVLEKQFFKYYPDGGLNNTLKDTFDNQEFFLPNSSSNVVKVELVSTTGSGGVSDTGNSFLTRTYLILVDSAGVLSYNNWCDGCQSNPNGATQFFLQATSGGYFFMECQPDIINNNPCWVKALVTINTITIG